MACLNPKKVRKADVPAGRFKVLRALDRGGPQRTEDLKSWLTPISAVRGDLVWLLERHLIAPVTATSVSTRSAPGFSATVRSHDGRSSMSTNQVTTRSLYATPGSVSTDPLLWALTATGAAVAFQGIVVRGSRSVPDRGRHWVCPRGVALRELAVRRLRRREEPLEAPSRSDERFDEFVFALTSEHTEAEAFAQMSVHRPELSGFSFAEQLRAGDEGVERAVGALVRHLLVRAGSSYRGPLGARRAEHADPSIVAIQRNMATWGFSHGYADAVAGRLGWCCTSPGAHDHLGLPARLEAAGLLDADATVTRAR